MVIFRVTCIFCKLVILLFLKLHVSSAAAVALLLEEVTDQEAQQTSEEEEEDHHEDHVGWGLLPHPQVFGFTHREGEEPESQMQLRRRERNSSINADRLGNERGQQVIIATSGPQHQTHFYEISSVMSIKETTKPEHNHQTHTNIVHPLWTTLLWT